jgi:hypothetical protein
MWLFIVGRERGAKTHSLEFSNCARTAMTVEFEAMSVEVIVVGIDKKRRVFSIAEKRLVCRCNRCVKIVEGLDDVKARSFEEETPLSLNTQSTEPKFSKDSTLFGSLGLTIRFILKAS